MELVAELELPRAVMLELCQGFHAQMNMAAIEQENIGHATKALGPAKPIEGLGQPKARIQPDIYWRMVQKFGRGCWQDKKFLDSYLAKNPGARVSVQLKRTTILRP